MSYWHFFRHALLCIPYTRARVNICVYACSIKIIVYTAYDHNPLVYNERVFDDRQVVYIGNYANLHFEATTKQPEAEGARPSASKPKPIAKTRKPKQAWEEPRANLKRLLNASLLAPKTAAGKIFFGQDGFWAKFLNAKKPDPKLFERWNTEHPQHRYAVTKTAQNNLDMINKAFQDYQTQVGFGTTVLNRPFYFLHITQNVQSVFFVL